MIAISPVILSGGAGRRLWPVSRAQRPKHLLRFHDAARTLLQDTALRVAPPAGEAHDLSFFPLLVIGNAGHAAELSRQLAEVDAPVGGIVLEPVSRNTAAAACVAALLVQERAPQSLLLLLPADHYIGNVAAFHGALARAAPEAHAGRIVTFGIEPTRPETGYGYIRRGTASPRGTGVFEVESFVEKPDREKAQRYVDSRAFYWNAGLFLALPAVVLSELMRHAEPVYSSCRAALSAARSAGQALTLDRKAFGAAPALAFDRAVMEKTKLASVVPVAMDWCDIGSWQAVWELSEKDGENNVAEGPVFLEDCRNSLVRAESRLVAVIGVDDLVVVETAEAVLVMPRAEAQRLSAIVQRLEKETRREKG